jgi:hypothetical protein
MKRLIAALAGAVLLTSGVARGGGTPDPGAPPSAAPTAAPSAHATAPAIPPPAEPTVSPSPPGDGWTSGTLTVYHEVKVPPVPTIVRIRHAQHPADGYDRVVFDVLGKLPGYEVRYVARPIADGRVEPVSMPGRQFLQIRFEPACAHDGSGRVHRRPRTEAGLPDDRGLRGHR